MNPESHLVNVVRGALVDERALIGALREGWIGSASLDVFALELLEPGHPVWGMENVFVSPYARCPSSAGVTPHSSYSLRISRDEKPGWSSGTLLASRRLSSEVPVPPEGVKRDR